jgi:hypothetical protein
MEDPTAQRPDTFRWLLHEPLVHFFALGAILFGVSHVRPEETRRIAVPPGLEATLERSFRDLHGRDPSAGERTEALAAWRRDEALYREALQKNLHQNDATIRGILIDKMRAEAALDLPPLTPTDAELESWLRVHGEKYALPRRYDFQFVAFEKSSADIEASMAQLGAGTEAGKLGRPVTGGKLTEQDLATRLPKPLAERIPTLAPGTWERVDGDDQTWVVRVRAVLGGVPPLSQVRARVEADFVNAAGEKDLARRLQETVDLYTFEAAP